MAIETYHSKSLAFKIRKVLRYVRIYGASRTLAKVRAQYHMIAREGFSDSTWSNPRCKTPLSDRRFVALVGCGSFAYSTLAYYLREADPHFLRYAMDTDPTRARSLCSFYNGAIATTDVSAILNDPDVRLVVIASNHASHAEYAIKALERGKSVHIEKPHVVSHDQLERLKTALVHNPGAKLFLGFNRPRSAHFKTLMSALAAQSGPLMINWFIAGHAIEDDHWYFDEAEGGRILGNLCHWTDLTLAMIGLDRAFPCVVTPTAPPQSKSDFCTSFLFADGSVAAITFSAKGHTFEGVREILHVHRGDVLGSLYDFERTRIEIVERKYELATFRRDHGHRANVLNSYHGAREQGRYRATSVREADATARLFLAVRQAFQEGQSVTVSLDVPPDVPQPPLSPANSHPDEAREQEPAAGSSLAPKRGRLSVEEEIQKNQ